MATKGDIKMNNEQGIGFGRWLLGELEKRGWSQSELATRAQVSHGRVSQVISGDIPTSKILVKLAYALQLRPEDVLRRAGVLPPLPSDQEKREAVRMMELFDRLAPAERERVLEYVEFVLSRGKR